jgi:hypothetical protein
LTFLLKGCSGYGVTKREEIPVCLCAICVQCTMCQVTEGIFANIQVLGQNNLLELNRQTPGTGKGVVTT